MCREANLASSSSWMYVAYNYLLIWCYPYWSLCLWQKGGEKFDDFDFYFNPFVDDWQKRGEVFGIYACFSLALFIKGEYLVFLFMHICFVLQIGEKEFDLVYAC